MKHLVRLISFIVISTILFASCASTTLIQSIPSGANVYIDGQKLGSTPYSYKDTKPSGAQTDITLKLDGYKNFNVTLVRDEKVDAGAIIGGIFVLIPFIWTMKYDPVHTYELEAVKPNNNVIDNSNNSNGNNNGNTENSNSAKELIKLKNLLDSNAITQDDFTTIKVRILSDKYDYNNSTADQIAKLKELKDASLLTESEYTSQKDKLVNAK